MSKAVVYIFLATAFILLTFGLQRTKPNPKGYGARGLSRRLGFKNSHGLFDPLVAKMERFAEENHLDNKNFPTNCITSPIAKELDQEDTVDFLSDEGRLNITMRLQFLFPYLDKSPEDGFVESKELQAWIMQQTNDRLKYRTEKEMASRDKDADGAVSFREYLPHLTIKDLEKNGMGHGEAGWWKEQFKNADIDQNGILNFYEFNEFLHPEDSNNEQIQKWLLKEKIKPIDNDHDGKLNFKEFKNGAYDIFKNYIEFENGGANVESPEEMFQKLDTNNDKLLEIDELKPILQYLSPGEIWYARYYASYLIHEADEDGDGKLSLDEMLTHEYIFYNTVYEDEIFDEDGDLHEEL